MTGVLACLSAPIGAQALDHGALHAQPVADTDRRCFAEQLPLPADLRAPACLLVHTLDAAGALGPRHLAAVAGRLR
jgi:hypothetical protein